MKIKPTNVEDAVILSVMCVILMSILKPVLPALQIITTILFVVAGTVVATAHRWWLGLVSFLGTCVYVYAWMLIPIETKQTTATIASLGVALWAVAVFGTIHLKLMPPKTATT